MENNFLYLKSCCCISLKTCVIIIGTIVMVFGILHYLSELALILIIISAFGSLTLNFSNIILLLLDAYQAVNNIIFGGYLIYGTVRDIPRKSGFIFAWMLLKILTVGLSIFNLFMTTVIQNSYDSTTIMDKISLLVAQVFFCYIVYSYYRTLPKSQYQDD